jgi:hypothetical protein
MNPPLAALLALLLAPLPAVAQSAGSLTLLEGSLRVIRGSNVLQAAESIQVKQGDILETGEGGFAQLEFAGAIVALGPASRLYILRQGASGKSAEAELVLLSGWMKAEANSGATPFQYETPSLAATTTNGSLVFHANESGCDLFLESGAATISEISPEGHARQPKPGKAGQFFSRYGVKEVTTLTRPTPAFIQGMPTAFRDTLPSRLAHFKGKPAEAKIQHAVSYAEVEPWLTMPAAWRRGFVERFEPRLKDPEFRKQLEARLNQYPEWDPILHPEKHPPGNAPATVPNSQSPRPRVLR